MQHNEEYIVVIYKIERVVSPPLVKNQKKTPEEKLRDKVKKSGDDLTGLMIFSIGFVMYLLIRTLCLATSGYEVAACSIIGKLHDFQIQKT